MIYPGIYKAKALTRDGLSITAQIAQVFADKTLTITEFVGERPEASQLGWVIFQAGNPEFPVWLNGPT